ncbi:hypothetical protein C7S15_5891 [Burkholderia cepacia]|nr:hypothetical protein [Burkholderia cepacia]
MVNRALTRQIVRPRQQNGNENHMTIFDIFPSRKKYPREQV